MLAHSLAAGTGEQLRNTLTFGDHINIKNQDQSFAATVAKLRPKMVPPKLRPQIFSPPPCLSKVNVQVICPEPWIKEPSQWRNG